MSEDEMDVYEEFGLADWPVELDREDALAAIVAFLQVLDEVNGVGYTITSDFENTVRGYLDPASAADFVQDRGPFGKCMAKVLTRDDGRQVVVFDALLFLKGQPSAVPVFRHEALHVLTYQRGEALNTSRTSIQDHQNIHADLIAMAGVAAEEYCVDRALSSDAADLWATFSYLCATSHNTIHEAAVACTCDHDIDAFRRTVITAFAALTVQAAYVAAWLEVSGLPTPRLEDPGLDDRMLGAPWDDVLSAFRRFPPADSAAPRDELDSLVIELARRLEDWIEEIGFRPEALPDGSGYFHIYDHEDWYTRGPVDVPEAA